MIDEAKLALQALESVLDGMTEKAVQYKKVSEAIPALRAAIEAAERRVPVAWLTADLDRCITAKTYSGAKKDGGAMWSSVQPYSVPAYAHPPAITDDMVERAALGMANAIRQQHYLGSIANLSDIEGCEYYKAQARAALEAAWGVKHAER